MGRIFLPDRFASGDALDLYEAAGGGGAGQGQADTIHRLQRRAKGISHCIEVGCLREELGVPSGERHELCRALHAEQNAIAQAALHGVKIAGSTLYCTHQPCSLCAKMIINAGIVEVYFDQGYPDELATGFFAEAGIKLHKIGG